jgi:hypothetical protein
MSKKIILWIWFGLFLRILIMPFSGHTDLFVNFVSTFRLVDSGIIGPYKYFAEYYSDESLFFLYDPLHYYLFGLWSGLTTILAGPEYSVWMQELIDSMYLDNLERFMGFSGAVVKFKALFIWKSLYLIFDLLVLFCILRILPQEKDKVSFVKLWAGSFVILYSLYLFGQSGIIPTGLIVLGLYFYYMKLPLKWVGLCFALSVPFKIFSLLILPLPFLLARGWREKIETACYSLLPLLVIYVPIAIHSNGLVFWRIYGGYMAYAIDGLSWKWVLISAKGFLGVGYLAVCYHAWFMSKGDPKDLARYLFIVLLLLLCVPLKIYYYIWVLPFWFLFSNEKKAYKPIYFIIIFLLFFSNLSSKPTFIGILAPLDPDFFMAFPGWMDISYFLFPSGIHTKISVLIILFLTLAVIGDQLLVLFGKDPVFKELPDTEQVGIKTGVYVIDFPVALFICFGALFLVSHSSVKPFLKDYMFTRSGTPLKWYSTTELQVPPGTSLTQQVPLYKGRIMDMRYLVQRPISGPIKIEISTDSQSFQTIFEKNFEGLQQGWKKFVLEPNFIKDKMVYFRITNLSSEQWSIPLYRLPKNLSNYKLALSDGVSKKDKVIPHGLLPLSMTEEPLFFQGEKTPIKSILNSLNQEIGFILLWFILIVFCYWQACRYWKTS